MNPREALFSISQRVLVDKPSSAEVTCFLNNILPGPREQQLKNHRIEQFVLTALKPIRDEYIKQGLSASRVKLSAAMILQGNGLVLKDMADKALRDGQIPFFRFFFDLRYGLRTTMMILLLAEGEISGETQADIAETVSTTGEIFSTPASEQAQRFLMYQREAKKDADLLKQDPSGFTLIDDYLKDLGKETHAPLSEEYVQAGARLAADLYKSVYQISSKLTGA